MHSWVATGEELLLVECQARPKESEKDLACFGAVRQDPDERFLCFSGGQPESGRIVLMLQRLRDRARHEEKRVLFIIRDRVNRHKCQELKRWLR